MPDFAIAKYPVTFREYGEFLESLGDHPDPGQVAVAVEERGQPIGEKTAQGDCCIAGQDQREGPAKPALPGLVVAPLLPRLRALRLPRSA